MESSDETMSFFLQDFREARTSAVGQSLGVEVFSRWHQDLLPETKALWDRQHLKLKIYTILSAWCRIWKALQTPGFPDRHGNFRFCYSLAVYYTLRSFSLQPGISKLKFPKSLEYSSHNDKHIMRSSSYIWKQCNSCQLYRMLNRNSKINKKKNLFC